jgi:hypothetical protein
MSANRYQRRRPRTRGYETGTGSNTMENHSVDGYAVPVDPMDLMQCDSCQLRPTEQQKSHRAIGGFLIPADSRRFSRYWAIMLLSEAPTANATPIATAAAASFFLNKNV